MLIAPTEPQRLTDLGTTSLTPEKFGCDILVIAGKNRVGVQRKAFPNDFLTSLADGRLYTQLNMMQSLERSFVIVEGRGKWTTDGELMSNNFRSLNRGQLFGLFFSIMFEFGTPVLWVEDIGETVEVLVVLEHWVGKKKHNSLKTRPGPKKDSWGKVGNKGYASHLMQGFPGVGPDMAERIVEHFEGVPLTWTCSPEEMLEVAGVGKVTVGKMWDALEWVESDGGEG